MESAGPVLYLVNYPTIDEPAKHLATNPLALAISVRPCASKPTP
jgi:hypothetical protein